MAKAQPNRRGRPPVLDEQKQLAIRTIVSVGGTRRLAAQYVGCAVRTISLTAARDAKFREQLAQAESSNEVSHLQNLKSASKQEKYWRAAAWALERMYPERYGRRQPMAVTVEQVKRAVELLADIILEEVPVAKTRNRILARLEKLGGQICTHASHDDKEPT